MSEINYQSLGSGAGIKQLTSQTVFFGASDQPMTPEQMQAAPGRVLHFPTVLGAVVPIYNMPGVTQELKFTGPVLANIVLGKITKWNDPALAASTRACRSRRPTSPSFIAPTDRERPTSGSTFSSKVSPEFLKTVGVAAKRQMARGCRRKRQRGRHRARLADTGRRSAMSSSSTRCRTRCRSARFRTAPASSCAPRLRRRRRRPPRPRARCRKTSASRSPIRQATDGLSDRLLHLAPALREPEGQGAIENDGRFPASGH